jgi:archaellum component FlaC
MNKRSVVLASVLGGVILSSCAAANNGGGDAGVSMSMRQNSSNSLNQIAATIPPTADTANEAASKIKAPARVKSQLIKKATMSIVVESIDKSINDVTQIIDKQQGDLIKLAQNQPKDEFSRSTASIQLRVPQTSLDDTLTQLAKLGIVKNRSITAEDVGDRIVDFQAQLVNLRRTETNLQKIMDKAGSVRDTLSVSQELSNIRDSIERIGAQLKNLQNQVSYSTISLNLEAAVSTKNPQRGFGLQVQETWNKSTNSVGKFSMGLLKLAIWLMAYSPYVFILAFGIYGFNRWRSAKTGVKLD